MATARRTQPETKTFRRATLISATIHIVAKHGIEKTTIAKICEAAGVSRGLSGHYFRDKSDLLSQAYQHLLTSQFDHTAVAAASDGGDASARLKAIVRACFPSSRNSRVHRTAYLAFWTLSMTDPRMAKITSDAYRDFSASIEGLLQQAANQSDQSIDVREATIALVGLIDGLWLDISIGVSGVTRDAAFQVIARHIDQTLSRRSPR